MTVNKLKLNTNKTGLLELHSSFRSYVPMTSFTVGKDTIYPTEHARNIAIFDSAVTFSKHVDPIVKSAFYNLRSIAKIRQYLSFDTAKALVVELR